MARQLLLTWLDLVAPPATPTINFLFLFLDKHFTKH